MRQILRDLYFQPSISAFYIDVDEFTGTILDVNLAVEYNIWKHVGVGIAYNNFYVDIDSTEDSFLNFNGSIEYELKGVFLYGKLYC